MLPIRNNRSVAESEIETRANTFSLLTVISLQNYLFRKCVKSSPIKVCIKNHVNQTLMRMALSTDDGTYNISNFFLFLFSASLFFFFHLSYKNKAQ